jgi:hypothetical protein
MPVKLENEDIRTLRRRLADVQMLVGAMALYGAIFTGLSPFLLGLILLFLGGVGAIGVYWAAETWLSRRFSLWSIGISLLGGASLTIAAVLMNRT